MTMNLPRIRICRDCDTPRESRAFNYNPVAARFASLICGAPWVISLKVIFYRELHRIGTLPLQNSAMVLVLEGTECKQYTLSNLDHLLFPRSICGRVCRSDLRRWVVLMWRVNFWSGK